jgi:hypothetical protein
VLGFSTVLTVCQGSVDLLLRHPAYAPLVRAYWSGGDVALLPATPERSIIFYLLHLVHSDESPGAVRSALVRDMSGLLAVGGTYLCSTFLPVFKHLLKSCEFDEIPAARNQAWGAEYPVDGFVLDLHSTGFEPWVDAVLSGRRPPCRLDRRELEGQLHAALLHWDDSVWLARSPLAQRWLEAAAGTEAERSLALRDCVQQALARARAQATPEMQQAYGALELAYLPRKSSRKQAARSLSVSRATFYRLIKRGIRGVADGLSEPVGIPL